MIQLKFSSSFDYVLEQAYRFHTEFLTDKATFVSASPLFDDPFAADFLTDIEAADALPTFDDDRDDLILYTQEVENKMEEARVHFQKLMFYVNLAWPDDNGIARGFGSSQYKKARKSTLKLINLIQKAYIKANSTTYKSDLIAAGFVQADIDLLNTLADEITEKNNAQEDYMSNTYERSETRIIAFNKVWDSMVKLSDASKVIFKNSPAKIEYYLLYPSGSGGGGGGPVDPPAAPANLQYNESTGEFSWSAAAYATSYQLQYKAVMEEDWDEAYAGSDTSVVFDPGAGDWNFRVRARNAAGFGDFSNVIEVNIAAALVPPVNVQVTYDEETQVMTLTWDAVPGADSYKYYNSESTIGQPPGNWYFCTNPSGDTVNVVFTVGKRNWYHVSTVIGTEESEMSEDVYYDLPV